MGLLVKSIRISSSLVKSHRKAGKAASLESGLGGITDDWFER